MEIVETPWGNKLFTHDDGECFYSAVGQNITEIIGNPQENEIFLRCRRQDIIQVKHNESLYKVVPSFRQKYRESHDIEDQVSGEILGANLGRGPESIQNGMVNIQQITTKRYQNQGRIRKIAPNITKIRVELGKCDQPLQKSGSDQENSTKHNTNHG